MVDKLSTAVQNQWLPTLEGPSLLVRAITKDDFEDLYQVAADATLWALHSEPNRYERPVFQKFFDKMVSPPQALVVIDKTSNQVIGSSRYYDSLPLEHSVVIGYTFLAKNYWGGPTNSELKKLMIDYAFQYVDSVFFHTSKDNFRSQRAIAKLGAVRSDSLIEVPGVGTRVEYRLTKRLWDARNG